MGLGYAGSMEAMLSDGQLHEGAGVASILCPYLPHPVTSPVCVCVCVCMGQVIAQGPLEGG